MTNLINQDTSAQVEQGAAPGQADLVDHSEYKLDGWFLLGYVILLGGLIFLGWDPRYVLLGVTIELAIAVAGYQSQCLFASRGATLAFSILLCGPAFLIAVGFSASTLLALVNEGEADWMAALGLLAFVVSSCYSNVRRFMKTTLRGAIFYRHLNQTYRYENGKPVLRGPALITGAVLGTWVATIYFFIAYMIALAFGTPQGVEAAGSFSTTSAITLASLCIARQAIVSVIVALAPRKRDDVESMWLKTFEAKGTVVRRTAEDAL